MKLIDEWKQGWRYLSVQVSTIAATAAGVYLALPEEQREAILKALGIDPSVLVLAGFVMVVLARLKAQPGLKDDGTP